MSVPETLMRDVWKLRTSPFAPKIDKDGKPLPPEAVVFCLDPRKDQRALQYYFDVYDWESSKLVRDLSHDCGLRVFPKRQDLSQALMVLASGHGQTGRDSLVNLVLHQIVSGAPPAKRPLIVDVVLDGFLKGKNVKAVAQQILFELETSSLPKKKRKEVVEQLSTHYDRVTAAEADRPDATYANMFLAFKKLLDPLSIQIVIRIVKGGDSDSWIRIYESVRELASYVLVVTQDYTWAKTCYDQMVIQNYSIAWIRAQKLDLSTALRYVAERVRSERLQAGNGNGETYAPFTKQAIEALYARGVKNQNEVVECPVGWLRLRLSAAFDEKLGDLAKQSAHAAPLAPPATLIDVNTVVKVCSRLNQGG